MPQGNNQNRILILTPVLVFFVLMIKFAEGIAVDVYRCADDSGVIIYSESACGPDAEIQTYDSDTQLNGSEKSSDNSKQQLENYRLEVKKIDKLLGNKKSLETGNKKNIPSDNCETVTSLQLRNAKVAREVIKCHSKKDVNSILGKPKYIKTWSDRKNYDTRWTYRYEKSRKTVFFKNGHVVKWTDTEY